MSFERIKVSSIERDRALEVIKKMSTGMSYPQAVRQVLTNERITHEPDVTRIMNELSQTVDEVRAQLDLEEAAWEEEKMLSDEASAHEMMQARRDNLIPEDDR